MQWLLANNRLDTLPYEWGCLGRLNHRELPFGLNAISFDGSQPNPWLLPASGIVTPAYAGRGGSEEIAINHPISNDQYAE